MAKTLTITLYMSELLYDFRNKAFLTGRSRKADGKDAEFASNMQANELLEVNNITLKLDVPSNFNLGIRDSLASAIHDYIINKALMDWYMITNKDDAKDYADLSAIALQNIHNAFNRRERPTRTAIE